MDGSHHCYHSIFSIFPFLIKPLLFIKTVGLLPRRVQVHAVYCSVSKGSVGLAGSSGRLLDSAWGLTCVGVLGLVVKGQGVCQPHHHSSVKGPIEQAGVR